MRNNPPLLPPEPDPNQELVRHIRAKDSEAMTPTELDILLEETMRQAGYVLDR